jgi:hypothetical protein
MICNHFQRLSVFLKCAVRAHLRETIGKAILRYASKLMGFPCQAAVEPQEMHEMRQRPGDAPDQEI